MASNDSNLIYNSITSITSINRFSIFLLRVTKYSIFIIAQSG